MHWILMLGRRMWRIKGTLFLQLCFGTIFTIANFELFYQYKTVRIVVTTTISNKVALSLSPLLNCPEESLSADDIRKALFRYCLTPNVSPAHTRLLLLVMSEPSAASKRALIRATWGHRRRLRAAGAGLVFVLGAPQNVSQLHVILREQQSHEDILLDGLLTDTYRNLTRKVLSGLAWTTEQSWRRLRFVAKVDMDNFVNVTRLREVGEEAEKEAGKVWMTGRFLKRKTPKRDKTSKFYVSKRQWSAPTYPRYFSGPAYMMSITAAHSIASSEALRELRNGSALFLEDVYITGVFRKRLHIIPVQNEHLFMPCASIQIRRQGYRQAVREVARKIATIHMNQCATLFHSMLEAFSGTDTAQEDVL